MLSAAVAAPEAVIVTKAEAKKEVTQPVTFETYVRTRFAEKPLLAEIARCESQFRHFSADGSVLRGRAVREDVGVMQINEYYHLDQAEKLGFDIHSVEGNMAYAEWLYDKQGAQPWSASAPCWGKHRSVASAS